VGNPTPIKQELSDTAMGFLIGMSFAIFCATLDMPIAIACRSIQTCLVLGI